jgi:hypothetical protein
LVGNLILVSAGTYRHPTGVFSATDKDADSQSPTILRADGEVIIDGADAFGDSTWTQHSGSIYRASRAYTLRLLPRDSTKDVYCYVFVDDARYKFVYNAFATLNEGEWSFDSTTSHVYVRLIGGGSPAGREIYITDARRSQGLVIRRSDNFGSSGSGVAEVAGASGIAS